MRSPSSVETPLAEGPLEGPRLKSTSSEGMLQGEGMLQPHNPSVALNERKPAYREQAAELSTATGRLNEAVASRDAEIERPNDALSDRDNELSSVKSERAALIVAD